MRRVLAVLGATVLLTSTAACGGSPEEAVASSGATPSSTTSSTTNAGTRPDIGPAKRIHLTRTGGVAGQRQEFDLVRDSVGSAEVFAWVETPEFRDLALDYPVANECCDRFRYTLTVDYHAAAKRITTIDEAPAPDILWRVIRRVQG